MPTKIELQYTPGPWQTYYGEDYIHIYGGDYNHSSAPLAEVRGGDDPEADAQLMAAAPDCYLALKEISKCTRGEHLPAEVVAKMMEAIAKVEGES